MHTYIRIPSHLYIFTHILAHIITGTQIKYTIKSLKSNTKVIYWASLPANSTDSIIDNPITAYGDDSNQGVGTTDNNGDVTITLNKPSIYIVPYKGKLPRHFHYRYWDNHMASPIYTVYI